MNSFILHLRVALKNPLGYAISIFSLTLGFAVCLLVFRFVQSESAYDMGHDNAENLYRIVLHNCPDGIDMGDAVVQFPLVKQLQDDYAGIASVLRIYRELDFPLIEFNTTKFVESRQLFVDSNFFSFFAFPLISGDPNTVLQEANSIVLTKKAATRYFGVDDPMGKTLVYQGKYPLVVTGIADDEAILSHVKFDMVIPMEFYFNLMREHDEGDKIESWLRTSPWAYVEFKDQPSKAFVESKLPVFADNHFPAVFKSQVRIELQPVTDIHTSSHYVTEIEPNTADGYLRIFLIIIFTILAFSTINFINLNSFVVLNRAKEFCVKGILGSSKLDMFREIFTSTFRIAFISLIVALALAAMLQHLFNLLMGVHLPLISLTADWLLLLYALAALVVISFLASLQPFLVFATGEYLQTITNRGALSSLFRKVAVGLQIACSFVLIFGTIIIFRQMNFLNNFDLGFDKENVIVLPFRQAVMDHFDSFKTEAKKIDGVLNVTWGGDAPGLGGVANYRFVPQGYRVQDPLFTPFVQVDYDFVETMGIQMKDGREFDASIPGDSANAYIVNQAFLESLGWADNYIGKELKMYEPGTQFIGFSGKVVGSFYDFHIESLHFPNKPLILALRHTFTHPGVFLIKTDGGNARVIDQLKNVWTQFESDWPFEFKMLDHEISRLYHNEDKLFYLSMILSMLAITISLVGLFGMNSIAIVKQFKAIAIKKVLGAHADSLSLEMLRKEIAFLATVFITTIPGGYFVLNSWLSGFENRIRIIPADIVQSIVLVLLLVFITVLYHHVKMRQTNPLHHIQRG